MSGELTAIIAENIKDGWEKKGYVVFYDHGKKRENNSVGNIVSTLKIDYGRDDELSQLDIAIVEQRSDKAVLLVEIEETSDRPKTLLGDIFGVLFGKHICFRKEELKELVIGDFTTLLVVGISKSKKGHAGRNKHIEDQANFVKASLETPNSDIGKVKIKIYEDEDSIQKDLPKFLNKVVMGEE